MSFLGDRSSSNVVFGGRSSGIKDDGGNLIHVVSIRESEYKLATKMMEHKRSRIRCTDGVLHVGDSGKEGRHDVVDEVIL